MLSTYQRPLSSLLRILLRQSSGKVFNLKLTLIGVAILCAFFALAKNAEAMSARFQFGFGDDSGFDYPLSYLRTDLNLFVHDGTLFDIFIGGELASSDHQTTCVLLCTGTIDSSYEYKAATVGMHIKPFQKNRVNPYLILGVVSGTVKYSATGDSYANITSLSRDKASFTTYRTGFGLNIAIIKKVAVEAELTYSGGVPAADAIVERSGSTSNVTMFDGSPVINIALGVRYYF